MPAPKKGRPVLDRTLRRAVFVEWMDAVGWHAGWIDLDQISERLSCTTILSVGYVLRENKDEIVLVQSVDTKNATGDHVLAIPKNRVLKVWEIDQ